MTRLYLQGSPDQKLCKELIHWLEQDKQRAVYIFDEESPHVSTPHPRMHPFCIGGLEGEALLRQIAWEGVFLSCNFKKVNSKSPLLDHFKRVQEEVHLLASDFGDLGIQLARNLLDNLAHMDALYLAKDLEGAFRGIPAIICGAGPSLEKAVDKLRELPNRALIMAGGAGISALEHFGITPHFIAGIDPYPAKERLQLKKSQHLPFFFQGRVASDLLKEMHGPKIWVAPSGHFPMEEWIADSLGLPLEKFDGGWNVATFLTALACHLGCDPVILVGVDLSGEDYAGQVMKGEGPKRDWSIAAEWLTQFKKQHPQVRGSLDSLERTYDLDRLIRSAPFKPVNLQECRSQFLESLDRVKTACNQLLSDKRTAEHFLIQFALEEEPAYLTLCKPVWEIWQHVFKREISDAKDLEINKWLFMIRICDALK